MRALVVEDDFISREVLRKNLAPFFEINIVVNGEEAVSAFKIAHDEHRPYSLIIMDIMMPVLDGLSAVRQIRAYEEENGITEAARVIMATALSDPKTVMQSFDDCGVEGYIVKPYDGDKLRKELEKLGLMID
ncbi:response regulator [Desulfobaculum senezii]|jgi:two-component system chemotaxis response regulator CheY